MKYDYQLNHILSRRPSGSQRGKTNFGHLNLVVLEQMTVNW